MNGLRFTCCFVLLFILFPADVFAKTACSSEKRPFPVKIVMNFEIADPYILQDQSFKQINAESEETRKRWLQENGLQEVWTTKDLDTLGYASGGMAANYRTSTYARSMAYRTYYCAYYKEIELNIIYRTLIRIPKEFPKGGCVYNIVLEHELRHHDANVDSFKKYMLQLQADLPKMSEFYESAPIRPGGVDRRFEGMQSSIKDAIDLYMNDFVFPAAAIVNKEIDSLESYAADSKKIDACSK